MQIITLQHLELASSQAVSTVVFYFDGFNILESMNGLWGLCIIICFCVK